MSMRDCPIIGYGFNVDEVDWDYKKLIEKLFETEVLSGDTSIVDEFNHRVGFFGSNNTKKKYGRQLFRDYDTEDEVYRLIIDGCTWLDYENASESANYIILYPVFPWESAKFAPKSEEECKEKMWEIIHQYVDSDFTYNDFESIVGRIEDTYWG